MKSDHAKCIEKIENLLKLIDEFKQHMRETQKYICENVVKDPNFDCPVRVKEFKICMSTCELSEGSQQVIQKEYKEKFKKINTFLKYLSTILDALSKEIRTYTERMEGEEKAKCEELRKKFEASIVIAIEVQNTFKSVKETHVRGQLGKCLPKKLKRKHASQLSKKWIKSVSQKCEISQEDGCCAKSIGCRDYVITREINTSLVHLENTMKNYKVYLSA